MKLDIVTIPKKNTPYLVVVNGSWDVAEWWPERQKWYNYDVTFDPEDVTEIHELPPV